MTLSIIVIIAGLIFAFYCWDAWNASRTTREIRDYEAGLAFDSHGIVEGRQPYLSQDGDPVCLLLHGYRGSPEVFNEMAEALRSAGIAFHAILLPGHGRRLTDLAASRWTNWAAAVESTILQMRTQRKKIVVIGISLGGTLGLHLASKQSVDGLIAISPFFRAQPGASGIFPPWLRMALSRLFLFTRVLKIERAPDIQDEEAREQVPRNPFYPIQTTRSLFEFGRKCYAEVRSVKAPVHILYSKQDQVADIGLLDDFFSKLEAPFKGLKSFYESGHELHLDREKQEVFDSCIAFIRQLSS